MLVRRRVLMSVGNCGAGRYAGSGTVGVRLHLRRRLRMQPQRHLPLRPRAWSVRRRGCLVWRLNSLRFTAGCWQCA